MSNLKKKPVVIGITGASGSILAFRLVKVLLDLDQPVEVIMTEKSQQVIFEEIGFKTAGDETQKAESLLDFLQLPRDRLPLLRIFANHRLDAPPASGTHLTAGMVVIPCSMGTLGRIAGGITDNLVSRSADVTLKENRRLILVPRETPLNQIHLRNLLTLSQCGAILIPPMLTFYQPDFNSLEGQILYILGKVLDHLGIEHQLHIRWGSCPGV